MAALFHQLEIFYMSHASVYLLKTQPDILYLVFFETSLHPQLELTYIFLFYNILICACHRHKPAKDNAVIEH